MCRKEALTIVGCVFVLTVLIYGGLAIFFLAEGGRTKSADLTAIIVDEPADGGQVFHQNSLPENQRQSVNFLFFGDMMLDRHVGEKIASKGLDHLFTGLATTSGLNFSGHDLVSANLEGAVTDGGAHYPPVNAFDFAFSPALINELKKYNFNFFNLANNHFSDQGSRGIIETGENLAGLGFNFSGCQDGEAGECSFKKLEVGSLPAQAGKKLGLAGFSMVYRMIPTEDMAKIVADLASTTDLVIVNMHWGVEYEHRFGKLQQAAAHALIDAGADMIIGHHPHVVQGMEIYKNKPIFYSLGNFIFDQYFSPDTQEGLAAGILVSGEKMEIYLFPFKSKTSQPSLMAGEEKELFFKKLVGWSNLDEEQELQILNGDLSLKY